MNNNNNVIKWSDKPSWAVGIGYSHKHGDWLWFNDSHYMHVRGGAKTPFTTNFTIDDMVGIQMASSVQQQPKTAIDWSNMPDWADVWIDPVSEYTKAAWCKDRGDRWELLGGGYWLKKDSSVYTVYYPPKTKIEWTGDGVPPVGTVCTLNEDTEFLCVQTGEVTIKKEGEKVVVVGHVTRFDNGYTCVTLQAVRDTSCGFTTINPDYVNPYMSDKDQWIEKAVDYVNKADNAKEALSAMYDAIVSGELKLKQ